MRLVRKLNVAQTILLKRHGNLFKKIISLENIELAYQKARRGKGRQRSVKRFEEDIPGNLQRIHEMLKNKTYHTATYKEKQIFEPKKRIIYILPFYPDRIIQHAIMNVLEPLWDGLFISDSYSCRKGKGIHKGSLKTMEFVRKNRYCLQCDISKFYPSVNHDVVFAIVQRKIKCPDTLWLLKEIIYSAGGGSNVPIGNYTSQWLGNLYMNELDMLIKQKFRIKHYLRYCDDFLLFHNDKNVLREMAVAIVDYVQNTLKMRLSECELFPTARGVDFLGYRHFPNGYVLLRKSTVKRVKKRLRGLPYNLKHRVITPEQYRSSISSTKGWLKWANTHNLQIKLKLAELEEVIQ
ncbi:MAG: reverse transcriptase domain-containing protein [Negativicutes bacterium]|nr:reverse transcriptase domain-containing protein [Negativicutes bacterium]